MQNYIDLLVAKVTVSRESVASTSAISAGMVAQVVVAIIELNASTVQKT